MIDSCEKTGAGRTRATVLFGLLLLLFFQLGGVWIESIYRLALIKLGPGRELYAGVCLLAPVVLFCVRRERERGILWAAVGVFLAARAMCPVLRPGALIVVAGLGVGAFLIVLCYAVSDGYGRLRGNVGVAAGLAVLMSVALRSWRSSLDISLDGMTGALGWVFVLAAVWLLRGVMRDVARDGTCAPAAPGVGSWWRRMLGQAGLWANFTVVFLAVSCPAVVNAWYGGGRQGYVAVVGLTVLAFAAALVWLGARGASPSRGVLVGINILFVSSLVGGILLVTPVLPASAGSLPVFVWGDAPAARLVLYLALLLSPVVIFNVEEAARFSGCARPRDAVVPVILGACLLVLATTLLIGTNTWGYVLGGTYLRNRFFMPFLIACIGVLVPFVMRRGNEPVARRAGGFVGAFAAAVAVVAMAGVVWCGSSRPLAAADPRRLTIMTYNMQQGSLANADRAYLKQLALLRRVNADIIGLQECDTARPSGGHVDVIRYFAESLGYFAYYGPNTVSGTYGTAILSRYPIRNPYTFFTFSDTDEVGTAVAEIDVDGMAIAFFSNHPAGSAPVMNVHVDALIAEAGKYANVIAVGDYNFTANEPYYSKLASVLAPSAATLGEANVDNHGSPPRLAQEIDHIFVSPRFRVVESHYLEPPESQTDHPAHWSVIQITE